MNLAPKTETVPAPVNKYLLPKEGYVLSIRQHPSVLVPPFAAAAGGLLAATAASEMPGDTGTPEIVVWILVIFLILKFMLSAVAWLDQYIVITEKRLIQLTGFFVRRVKDMPLANLDEMTFQRSFAGRLLGYGTFRLGPESDGQQAIDYIPYPEQIYLEVKGILERKEGKSDAD